MSTTTTNFGIVLPEGTDTFNPLTFNNDAFTLVDSSMKGIQDNSITTASIVLLDGIYTINRTKTNCRMFTFIATDDYDPSHTIAVDGVTMSFRYADGSAPKLNAFRINQMVLCAVNGTILTLVSCHGDTEIELTADQVTFDESSAELGDTVQEAIETLNDNLTSLIKSVTTDWIPLTFNNQSQVAIGTVSDLTNGKVTDYTQIKGISVVSNGYLNAYASSNKNIYAYVASLSSITSSSYKIRLTIFY